MNDVEKMVADVISSLQSSAGETTAPPSFRRADLRFGTIVKLPDGRLGTVVYKGYDGYGIAWGEIEVTADMFEQAEKVLGYKMPPVPRGQLTIPGAEAMLRDSHPDLPAVGQKVHVIRHQLEQNPHG